MADANDRDRDRGDRRDAAPGRWDETLQSEAGAEGGPRASQTAGAGGQPRQGSNRTETTRQASGGADFAPGRAPSEQGDQEHPSPHVIASHQQGAEPRSGSHAAGDRSEEAATSGEPRGDHTRHGRQTQSGDRANKQ